MGNGRISLTQRQRRVLWREHGPNCWRCGEEITGDWHAGHVIPHWLKKGQHWRELRPEHPSCNMADSKVQSRLANKTKRIERKYNGQAEQKPKRAWPSRPFPECKREIPSRPFPERPKGGYRWPGSRLRAPQFGRRQHRSEVRGEE